MTNRESPIKQNSAGPCFWHFETRKSDSEKFVFNKSGQQFLTYKLISKTLRMSSQFKNHWRKFKIFVHH